MKRLLLLLLLLPMLSFADVTEKVNEPDNVILKSIKWESSKIQLSTGTHRVVMLIDPLRETTTWYTRWETQDECITILDNNKNMKDKNGLGTKVYIDFEGTLDVIK